MDERDPGEEDRREQERREEEGAGEGPLSWGREEQQRRWAHRADPDLRGEPGEEGPGEAGGPREPAVGRVGGRYTAVVGVVFFLLVGWAVLNTLRSEEGGIGLDRGERLPEFAVPEARGSVEGDANVAQTDCETSGTPCPREDRRRSACDVRGRGIIRICDYFDRPLVISFWFTRGADCEPQQDVVERVGERYRGRVNFLSVNIRDGRDEVRELVRKRGWRLPVGHDRDGAVSNLYRVGVCPQMVFAHPGGVAMDSVGGELTEAQLERRVRALLRDSRRRERARRR